MIGRTKEQMLELLDNFMRRNENYAIEIYIHDSKSDLAVGKFLIPMERNYDHDKNEEYDISWGIGNSIGISYKETVACYEEKDDSISQTIYMIMKCGLIISICCVGLRI